jgi:hypothetical protein
MLCVKQRPLVAQAVRKLDLPSRRLLRRGSALWPLGGGIGDDIFSWLMLGSHNHDFRNKFGRSLPPRVGAPARRSQEARWRAHQRSADRLTSTGVGQSSLKVLKDPHAID